MSRPTLGQKIDPSPRDWTAPYYRGSTVKFVADNGYGAEDWNFAFDQAIDGHLYGFGQGVPSKNRREQAGGRFDVLFYTYENHAYHAVGLYLNAQWLKPKEVQSFMDSPAWKTLLKKRKKQFIAAFGPKRGKKTFKKYRSSSPVKWRVRVEDIITFSDRPVFTPPTSALRDTNAHNWADAPWQTLLDLPDPSPPGAPPSTTDGRLVTRIHTTRERSPAFIKALKRRRLAEEGALRCEACGFDFAKHYDLGGRTFIEGHHIQPLGSVSAEGTTVTEADIALLCANCHRVAHLTGALSVEALQALHTSPASKDTTR